MCYDYHMEGNQCLVMTWLELVTAKPTNDWIGIKKKKLIISINKEYVPNSYSQYMINMVGIAAQDPSYLAPVMGFHVLQRL